MMADPEPAPVHGMLSKTQVEKLDEPVFPISSAGLEREIIVNIQSAEVIFTKPDTGIRLVYTFKVVDGCWLLINYDNEST
jgi:hypothetical protein